MACAQWSNFTSLVAWIKNLRAIFDSHLLLSYVQRNNKTPMGSPVKMYLQPDFLPTHWPDPNHHNFSPGYSNSVFLFLPLVPWLLILHIGGGGSKGKLGPASFCWNPPTAGLLPDLLFTYNPQATRQLHLDHPSGSGSPGTYLIQPTSGPLTLMCPLPSPFLQGFCIVRLSPLPQASAQIPVRPSLSPWTGDPFPASMLCYPPPFPFTVYHHLIKRLAFSRCPVKVSWMNQYTHVNKWVNKYLL